MTDTILYKKNELIFQEGAEASCMFEILSGSVEVYASYGSPEQRLLTTLLPGDSFGEMGLIEHQPRSATALAAEKTEVRTITDADMDSYFRSRPGKLLQIVRMTTTRLRELTVDYADACKAVEEFSKAEEAGVEQDPVLIKRMQRFIRLSGGKTK